MNRKDFQGLEATRLNEAKVLLKSGHYSGAYYLAGYVVECALKACIAKQTRRHDFPDRDKWAEIFVHDLTKLMKIAGLQPTLDAEIKTDATFADNWNAVKDWREISRYGKTSQSEAEALIRAISDSRNGVLRWLKRHW